MNKKFFSNTNNFFKSSAYLERPRLRKLLENAVDYPLVAICAGAGYGKTREIYSFLQECDAYTTWIQLSERDNVVTRFWENYVHMISLTWPEIGARLAEIGFPETEDAFAKYETVRSNTFSAPDKFFLVYDDFHLLHNPSVLRFIERATNGVPPSGTVILISRTTPDFNLIGMLMREQMFTIQEDTLRFTENEIAEYFKQLELSISRQNIHDIYDDTQGWAFAINLIGRSLSKDKKYERYALETMKENIYKLIESEISLVASKELWHFLLRISLIDSLAAGLIKKLTNSDALIKEMEALNAYIRYDSQLGMYIIHHLFLDYLRQKQDQLTEEERRETYQSAGEWSENNGYQVDALSYYEKSKDWDAVLRIAYMLNFPAPQDIAKYLLEIADMAPKETLSKNPIYPAVILKMKLSLGLINEANALAEQFAKEYETYPETP
jgi:LuxR family maltose regulon positive regulatory protein